MPMRPSRTRTCHSLGWVPVSKMLVTPENAFISARARASSGSSPRTRVSVASEPNRIRVPRLAAAVGRAARARSTAPVVGQRGCQRSSRRIFGVADHDRPLPADAEPDRIDVQAAALVGPVGQAQRHRRQRQARLAEGVGPAGHRQRLVGGHVVGAAGPAQQRQGERLGHVLLVGEVQRVALAAGQVGEHRPVEQPQPAQPARAEKRRRPQPRDRDVRVVGGEPVEPALAGGLGAGVVEVVVAAQRLGLVQDPPAIVGVEAVGGDARGVDHAVHPGSGGGADDVHGATDVDRLDRSTVARAALDDERQMDQRVAPAQVLGHPGVAHVADPRLDLGRGRLGRADVDGDVLLDARLAGQPVDQHAAEPAGGPGHRHAAGRIKQGNPSA